MLDKTEATRFQPTDRMSMIINELSSKRLINYTPGLYRVHVKHLMFKTYIHKEKTTDNHIDNSTSTGLQQESQPSRHKISQQSLQNGSQQGKQHCKQHSTQQGLHQGQLLIYDMIYSPLG